MRDEGAQPAADAAQARACPWCASVAADGATTCASCGAALAQLESLGDVRIPGLTSVDPALTDYASRPMQLRGPSSSQGVAPAILGGVVAGGPAGALLIGGVVAVAAAEYLGARQPGTGGTALDSIGRPSELALQALEHAKAAKTEPAPPAPDAAPEPPADAAAADGGMSVWRDLPPSAE